MSAKIEVNAVGPVVEFEYEMDEPGVHVLKGDHGAGKTTILRTVQLATDGRADGGKPTKRDGAKRGEATVAGKTITIGKSIREEGELSLEGLGDLDLAGLHSPKFLDAATRDKHRIRALVRLAGVNADPALFHELLGGRGMFEEVVDAAATETDDLVEMAAKIKRCIEKAAQSHERQAETARANLRAKQDQFAGIDLTAPHDESQLQQQLQSAIERRSATTQRRADALEVKRRAGTASEKLSAMQDGVQSVDQAQVLLTRAVEARCAAEQRVDELQRQLASARSALDVAVSNEGNAELALESAELHAEMVSEWKSDIDAAASVECPSEADIESAQANVDAANAAVMMGFKVRSAITAKEQADRYSADANGYDKSAKHFRNAAAATQDVLSEAIGRIPNCPLKVWNDADGNSRLVIETDRSDREPFDDLSDGERYDVLFGMLAKRDRVIVLSQAGWGEMSPSLRGRAHELARQRECYILTAQADDGTLRGEAYESELAVSI